MNKTIFLKIISIITVFVIIISTFCINAFALGPSDEDLAKANATFIPLKPGTAFAHFDLGYSYSTKSASPVPVVGNSYSFTYHFAAPSTSPLDTMTNIFFNVNLDGNGYYLEPDVNYWLDVALFIPTTYGPNEASGFYWFPLDQASGIYSWKSVSYGDRYSFNGQFTSPDFDNFAEMEQRGVGHDYRLPLYNIKIPNTSVKASMIRYEMHINRSTGMNLKSLGFELPISNAWAWHGYIGIASLGIRRENTQVGVNKPNYVGANSSSSGNTSSNNTSIPGGTSPGEPNFNTSSDGQKVTINGNDKNMFNNSTINNTYGIEADVYRANGNNIGNIGNLTGGFKGIANNQNHVFRGLYAATTIFSKLYNNSPWLSSIVLFALTLGFIAFVLNLGITVINSAKRSYNRHNSNKNNNNNKEG